MNELKLEYLKLKKKTRSWLGPILVFWLIMLAFPLTVEFMQDKLEIGFFSVLWIAILISMMLATEDIFIEDYNDGSLEQTIIKNTSFQFLISIRIVVYWLMIGVPISILSFIFSLGTSEDLLLSISVITSNCMTADGYATAFKAMGIEKVKDFLKTHPELKVFLIFENENKELETLSLNGFPEN